MHEQNGLALLDYLVTSRARKGLLQALWGRNAQGSVRELADLAQVAPSAANKELTRMKRLGLVETERVGNAKVIRANDESPFAGLLKHLLSAEPLCSEHEPRLECATVRQWLAHYSGPNRAVMATRSPNETVPGLEHVFVHALRLSHEDAALTRALPAVLWHNRYRLKLDVLLHDASHADQSQTLGFMLELTGLVSGDETFVQAAVWLRDKRYRRNVFYFHADEDSHVSRDVVEECTPDVARRWNFLMNMPLDRFQSTFDEATRVGGTWA